MTSWFKRLAMALFVGLLGIVASLTPVGSELEETGGLYWLFHLRGPIPAPSEVVVVAIDQSSADQLSLPIKPSLWPRNLHANLIKNLSKAGAQVIVFDLRFDTPSGVPEYDVELAAAMRDAGNVVIVERLDVEEISFASDHAAQAFAGMRQESPAQLLPIIAKVAVAKAPFALPRASRVNEYWAFKSSAGDAPTLPVVALQVFALQAYDDFMRLLQIVSPMHAEQLPANKNRVEIEGLVFTLRDMFTSAPELIQQITEQLSIDSALDSRNRRIIEAMLSLYSGHETRYLNFYGPPRSVLTVPYHHAIKLASARKELPRSEGNDFRGKAVFVGFSAATQPEQDKIRDDYHTVFSRADGLYISGVEIAATAFANLLENRPIQTLPLVGNLSLILFWGFAAGIAYSALSHRNAITFGITLAFLSIALILIYLYIAYYQFKHEGIWLPLVLPLLQVPLALLGALSLTYYEERQERKTLNKAFEKFLPERVVAEITRSADSIADNQLVYGACLATDAEMYTTLAEQMHPAELGVLINDYYATLFEPVNRHEGIVSDVVGDAMLAVWSTPSADYSIRKQACLACLDLAEALEDFNRQEGRPRLLTRMGLHFGEMLLGCVGALHHYEYRAVGDMVNTTNRIQGLNKYLGTRLLVSDKVVEGLDDFLTRPLGNFLLAGKTSSVRVAELMTFKDKASSEQKWLCEIFAYAVNAYELQDWPKGCHNFSEILKAFPNDGPAQFYLRRCQDYRVAAPVGEWDACVRIANK